MVVHIFIFIVADCQFPKTLVVFPSITEIFHFKCSIFHFIHEFTLAGFTLNLKNVDLFQDSSHPQKRKYIILAIVINRRQISRILKFVTSMLSITEFWSEIWNILIKGFYFTHFWKRNDHAGSTVPSSKNSISKLVIKSLYKNLSHYRPFKHQPLDYGGAQ